MARQRRPYSERREDQLRRIYGVTLSDYHTMLIAQSGRCGICCVETNPAKDLCVDHDHKTGRVRGLLCDQCNTGIGKLGDSREGVMRALRYLEQYQ